MPNMEFGLPKLKSIVRRGDVLLLSANLAPGPDYRAGGETCFPRLRQRADACLAAGISGRLRGRKPRRSHPSRRKNARVFCASWRTFDLLARPYLGIDGEEFTFKKGEALRLFFSYRQTAELVRRLVELHGLRIKGQWITKSKKRAFFVRKERCLGIFPGRAGRSLFY